MMIPRPYASDKSRTSGWVGKDIAVVTIFATQHPVRRPYSLKASADRRGILATLRHTNSRDDRAGAPCSARPYGGYEVRACAYQRYGGGRLYDAAALRYLSLDDLAELVARGERFIVRDAKTDNDITQEILDRLR